MDGLIVLHRANDNEKIVINMMSIKYFVKEDGYTRFFFRDGRTLDTIEHIDNIIDKIVVPNDSWGIEMLESGNGAKCSGGEALELLLPFVRIVEPQSVISKVGFRDGFAYATDKIVAVRMQTYTIQEDPTRDYPFARMDEIVSTVDSAKEWYRLDSGRFEGLAKTFLEKVASEAEERAHEKNGRYVPVDCPHCGEPMFFDFEKNRLVEEMKKTLFDPKTVPFYGRLNMGSVHVNIGFGYLYTACRSLEGLMFSTVKGQDNVGWLAMKTANGLARAILMPLTVEDDFEPLWTIDCVRV